MPACGVHYGLDCRYVILFDIQKSWRVFVIYGTQMVKLVGIIQYSYVAAAVDSMKPTR